jgi:hypothetical protein
LNLLLYHRWSVAFTCLKGQPSDSNTTCNLVSAYVVHSLIFVLFPSDFICIEGLEVAAFGHYPERPGVVKSCMKVKSSPPLLCFRFVFCALNMHYCWQSLLVQVRICSVSWSLIFVFSCAKFVLSSFSILKSCKNVS